MNTSTCPQWLRFLRGRSQRPRSRRPWSCDRPAETVLGVQAVLVDLFPNHAAFPQPTPAAGVSRPDTRRSRWCRDQVRNRIGARHSEAVACHRQANPRRPLPSPLGGRRGSQTRSCRAIPASTESCGSGGSQTGVTPQPLPMRQLISDVPIAE